MRLDITNCEIKIAQAGFFVKRIFPVKMRIHKNFCLTFLLVKCYIDVATSSDTA